MKKNTEYKLKPIVLVISPLSSLMNSQVKKLSEKGVKAVYVKGTSLVYGSTRKTNEITKDRLSVKNITSLEADIVFSSPESLLESNMQLITDLATKETVKTIFVHEAHCIKKK